jgi:hypothetical protein
MDAQTFIILNQVPVMDQVVMDLLNAPDTCPICGGVGTILDERCCVACWESESHISDILPRFYRGILVSSEERGTKYTVTEADSHLWSLRTALSLSLEHAQKLFILHAHILSYERH